MYEKKVRIKTVFDEYIVFLETDSLESGIH